MTPNRRAFLLGGATAAFAAATPALAQKKKPKLVLTGDMGGVAATLGFLSDDFEVWGIDRKRGAEENLAIQGGGWASKVYDADVIVHGAWEMLDPLAYQQASVNSTINLLNACAWSGGRACRFIFMSSAWAAPGLYGHKTLRGGGAASYYGVAKRFIEDVLLIESQQRSALQRVQCAAIRLGRVTVRQQVDENFGPQITMSDDEIRRAFTLALTSETPYRLIEPADYKVSPK